MGRLSRSALAFVALCTLCMGVGAEPITGFLASTAFTTAAGAAVTYGAVISAVVTAVSVVSSVYGSMQAKKQARRERERKFAEDMANLKDRTATLLSSDSAWPVVYGEPAPIGGSLLAVLQSGDKDHYKHVVMAVASHECFAIDDVYIDGESLALDPNGYATHPTYQLQYGIPRQYSFPYTVVKHTDVDPYSGATSDRLVAKVLTPGLNLGQASAPRKISVIGSDSTNYTGMTTFLGSLDARNIGMAFHEGFGMSTPTQPEGTTGTVTIEVDGSGSAIHVSKHLSPGGVDVADPGLRAALPAQWTEAHKLSGYTYVVITLNLLLEQLQGGLPNFTFKVRGKKVHDPRTGTTYYSRNPALCLADFIRSEVGYGASLDQIEVNTLIASANACDHLAYGSGAYSDAESYGNAAEMYVCDGMFRSDQDRDNTRQQIEDSMAGYSLESGGVWRILAGSWTTPVMALTDDDLLAPPSVVQTCNPGTGRFNGARGSYVNKGRNGVSEDFTPYQNTTFRGADGKDKMLDLALPFVGSHVRTHQIARTLVEQSRGGFILQINPKMTAWHLQPGDRIVMSSKLYGFTNKPFRVQDWTFSMTSPLAFQVIEDEERFYDLADEVLADAAPNTNLPSPLLKPDPPLDLQVESGPDQVLQQGGTLLARMKVSWAPSASSPVLVGGSARLEWRSYDPLGEWRGVDLVGDATEYFLTGLSLGVLYQVRVRFQTSYTASDWSTELHVLEGIGETPDTVTGLSLAIEAAGVIATWAQPEGLDLVSWGATQIRIGETWESGEIRYTGKTLSANIGWLPTGTVKVWAAHSNTQGDFGAAVSALIGISAPAQPIISGDSFFQQVELSWQDCKTSQPISTYIVKQGATWAAGTELGRTQATSYVKSEPAGTRLYWVTAYDAAGNAGAPGYVEVTVSPTIDEALEELQNGLDLQIADLLNVSSGISERLVDEAVERGTAITSLQNLVTEGDEQLAQRIDTVSARAVGYVRANLVFNGGFEFDLDHWEFSDGGAWGVVNDDWGTSARIPSGADADGWAMSPEFPAQAGTWYSASGDTQFLSDTGNSGLALEFFDAAGNTLGTLSNLTVGRHGFLNEQDRRNDFAVEALAPSGTASARLEFIWSGFSGAGSLGVRYLKAERGRFPVTPYTSEASDRGAVAAVQEEVVARANAVSAEAAARTTLAVRVNNAEAAIAQESLIRADETGALSARWGLKVTANNKVAGVLLNNDGVESNFTVLVDTFAVAQQDVGGVTRYPFVIGNVAGTPTVGIDGTLVVDGSILARHISVDRLSALTARLGYVTAGQLDISSDGAGGWGYVRSAGKWYRDGINGWALGRSAEGAAFISVEAGPCKLWMHSAGEAGWQSPGISMTNGGLTISQINVIDTLQINGQAVTVPSFGSTDTNDLTINHFVPGTANLNTYITGTTFLAFLAFVNIYVDGVARWAGAGLAGTTVTGTFVVALTPGWHTIRIQSGSPAGISGSSLYALSTRR